MEFFLIAVFTAYLAVSQAAPVVVEETNGVVGRTHFQEPYEKVVDSSIMTDPDVFSIDNFHPSPTHSASSPSSLLAEPETPAVVGTGGRAKCAKASRVRRIGLEGCDALYVDIGQCSGACNTRQQPSERFTVDDGVYKFPTRRSCKCCQTKATEIQQIRVRCRYHNIPAATYYRQLDVEVITKCHCRKCL